MARRLNFFVLLFLAGMLIVHGYVSWSVRRIVLNGYPDFTAFYGAGKMVLQQHSRGLYDAQQQWSTQQDFAQGIRIRKSPLPYLRPPFEALLFVPFALLPYPAAYLLWGAVNLGVAVTVPLLLRRRVRPLHEYPEWLVGLLPLAFTPVFLSLVLGQDSILLLLFYSLSYIAIRESADFRAGCLLGLGLFKPHLVVPFAFIALLRGRRRIVLGFLVAAMVLVLISALVVGWSELLRYPSYLWGLEQHSGRGVVLPRDTPNLRGLVEGILSGLVPGWIVFFLIGVSSVAVILWASKPNTALVSFPGVSDLMFCQSMVAAFLVSYHVFAYDLSIFLLPILVLAAHMSRLGGRRTRLTRVALAGPALFLFLGPVYPLLSLRSHAMNLVTVVLLFWMWCMGREISNFRAPSDMLNGKLPRN